MPNGGLHDVHIVYCPQCGRKNRFGIATAYSKEVTDGTNFICGSCGCTTLTLWQLLHTSLYFKPVDQTGMLCPVCSTWYAFGFLPCFCLSCGNKLRSSRRDTRVEHKSPCIEYLQGDIFAQNCDCVVVSANNWLAAGSGTAKAAVEQGGKTLWNWIAAKQSSVCPLQIGTAVLSPSGDLHKIGCKNLVFAISLGYRHFSNNTASGRILATPESVSSATESALTIAYECNARRIAIPLMGARKGYGTVQHNPGYVMLDAMLQTISEQSAMLQGKHLIITGPPYLNETARDLFLKYKSRFPLLSHSLK